MLDLYGNQIGAEGAKGLKLPASLQELYLDENQIGDEGAKGLELPKSLQILTLYKNQIGNEGAKAILKKIAQTNLTVIFLGGNPYNASKLNEQLVLQRLILLGGARINCVMPISLCKMSYKPLAQQELLHFSAG